MNFGGSTFAFVAFFLAAAGWALYWRRIGALRAARHPWGFQLTMAVALGAAVFAFLDGPGTAGGVFAAIAVLASVMFLFTSLASGLPEAVPTVGIGDAALDFKSLDARGEPFDSHELRGQAYLLKFFRGHW